MFDFTSLFGITKKCLLTNKFSPQLTKAKNGPFYSLGDKNPFFLQAGVLCSICLEEGGEGVPCCSAPLHEAPCHMDWV